MAGVGMMGTDTCVTEGDLVVLRGAPTYAMRNRSQKAKAEEGGATRSQSGS